jgi:uncharacterized protein (UPF0333 family)
VRTPILKISTNNMFLKAENNISKLLLVLNHKAEETMKQYKIISKPQTWVYSHDIP